MNKLKKIFSISLIIIMIFSSFTIKSSAARVVLGNIVNGKSEYKDSIGSETSDYSSNDTPKGKDKTQGMESSYKDVLINVNDTEINDMMEESIVYGTRAPIYSVKIPKTIILNKDGFGKYNIGIKGDIVGTQKITIEPEDKIENKDGVNFYMSEQNLFGDKKEDIIATVSQTKTYWTHSEINNDDFKYLENAGEINADNISAGSWKGTFNFNINVDTAEFSNAEYFSLYAPDIVTLESYGPLIKDGVNNFVTTNNVSYYAAITILLFGLGSDGSNDALIAAQESDVAFDKYFNDNCLDYMKEDIGCPDAKNADDLAIAALGFSIHDLANYVEKGETPEGYDPLKDYDGPLYLTIAYKYNAANDNRLSLPSDLVLPTHLFGYEVTGIADFAFSGHNEIEYIYVPSTYSEFTSSCFSGCTAKEIVIRSESFELTTDYFKNNKYLETITLPDNITEIPEGAFQGCANLKNIIYNK